MFLSRKSGVEYEMRMEMQMSREGCRGTIIYPMRFGTDSAIPSIACERGEVFQVQPLLENTGAEKRNEKN